MEKELTILSLNCRGLNDPNEMRKLFQWIEDNSYDIVCLQETFCTEKLKPIFDSCWKGKAVHSVTDSSHSRGVSIMFNNRFNYDIVNTHVSQDGRKVLTNLKIEGEDVLSIVSIYAPNNEKDRKAFFKNLSKWTLQYAYNTDNIVICGDFNCCLEDDDRIPRTHLNDSSRLAMLTMMKMCKLKDVWKFYCDKKPFRYTYIDKRTSTKSRLDYILISEESCIHHNDVYLVKPLKGDHKAVCVKLKYSVKKKGPGYWKLNSSVLKQELYQKGVQDIIKRTQEQYTNVNSKRIIWELIKINVKEFSIQYCKNAKKKNVKREVEIQQTINNIDVMLDSMSDTNPNRSVLLKEKNEMLVQINEIYDQKAKGAQIRSRAEWIEQGERNSKYFLGLENKRQNHNVIRKLQEDCGNKICNDDDILVEMTKFYEQLYTSANVSNEEINKYMEKCNTKKLKDNERLLCDQEITMVELCNAIDELKENKSPGLDGLTPEFYKTFKSNIVKPLLEMIIESHKEGQLPDSLKKAVVTLIFKKGDNMKLENYRPISLTNYDYKIIAFILATRMQSVIANIVNENQTAYIKKRYIGTNARLVQDIFEYCENTNDRGAILGLDFQKAFDTLEWPFILNTLKKFNFGDAFIKWIRILYTDCGIIFKNNGWLSCVVKPTRGIRQGCPISALLFVLSAEILAQNIRDNKKISGIYVGNNEYKISQYADDSYLFLSDILSIEESIKTINTFTILAGPKLNVKKTEGIWLGANKQLPKSVHGIVFTDRPLKCLGLYVGHDKDECYKKNWIDKLNKIEKTLDIWKRRQLSIQGKVIIVKSLIMSKLVYNFSLLKTPDDIISKIDKVIFNFIWNKRERIKRNTVIANVEDGGIGMVDSMCKNMSVKAAWIKRLKEGGKWTEILKYYLNVCGVDLDYMLKMNVKKECDCEIYRNLPKFYQEVLLSFNACKTNKQNRLLNTYDYLSSTIMGNDLIRSKGKCLYLKSWLESGIKYVKDLYDKEGNFISEVFLLEKLENKTNWIVEYAIVKKAVKRYRSVFNTEMSHYTHISEAKHIIYKNKIYDILDLKS